MFCGSPDLVRSLKKIRLVSLLFGFAMVGLGFLWVERVRKLRWSRCLGELSRMTDM